MPRRRQGRDRRRPNVWARRFSRLATFTTNITEPYAPSTYTFPSSTGPSPLSIDITPLQDPPRPTPTRVRRGRGTPQARVMQTPAGNVIVSTLDANAQDFTRQTFMAQFIGNHDDDYYPNNITLALDPTRSIHSTSVRYHQACIDGGIDHDRETKTLTTVGVLMVQHTRPNYFVIAVHPNYRRLGIGRELMRNLEDGVLLPTTWEQLEGHDRAATAAFLNECGLQEIERGHGAVRWGWMEHPTWWV